jgi:hypothetical protein
MPFRPRDKLASPVVTLSEALDWIAFDSFDGPGETPAEAAAAIFGYIDNVEEIAIAQYTRGQSIELAMDDLFAALRDGEVGAVGRLATLTARGAGGSHGPSKWKSRGYAWDAPERTPIPREFWWRQGVQWGEGVAKSIDCEYADIVLERQKVLEVWPLPNDAETINAVTSESTVDGGEQARPGRRRIYREVEFLALCVCEANTNGLPGTQAEFVKSMEELLSVVWGENRTPSETWLKEKVRPIYDQRARYEEGRQLLAGKDISRPK